MVLIDVIIAEGIYELAHFQATYMRDQMSQESIGTDIEGHAEERISRTLIKLAMKQRDSTLFNLELKQSVTGRQVNVIAFVRIPAADDQTPRVRIPFDLFNQTGDLIDAVSLRIMPAE